MPTPRGVVKLWSALRAYIDLTHAWWSPWTNRMLPTDGCGRPRGALFSSFLHSLGFQLVCFLFYRFSDERGLCPGGISLPALCTSLPAAPELFLFLKNSGGKVLSSFLQAGLHFVFIWVVLFSSCCYRKHRVLKICVLHTYTAVQQILCLTTCWLISSTSVESQAHVKLLCTAQKQVVPCKWGFELSSKVFDSWPLNKGKNLGRHQVKSEWTYSSSFVPCLGWQGTMQPAEAKSSQSASVEHSGDRWVLADPVAENMN